MKLKKSLSQNFLINPHLANKLLDAGHFHSGDLVLEIGPGGGALTLPLVEKGVQLTAIEISLPHADELKTTLGDKARIIHEDALKVDLKTLYPTEKNVSLVSSVPYNITSLLFEHLFSFQSLFKQYLVIVQKEVGNVLLAKPESENYGILSIMVQRFTIPKKLFIIAKGNFRPMPNVDSMALHLEAKPDLQDDAKAFYFFLKQIFSLRRKTLENAFRILGFPPIEDKRRAEMLSADELHTYFLTLKN